MASRSSARTKRKERKILLLVKTQRQLYISSSIVSFLPILWKKQLSTFRGGKGGEGGKPALLDARDGLCLTPPS